MLIPLEKSYHSPLILIYLEIDGRTVRLADVMENTATLYESAEFPPCTFASLVFSIDGVEERQRIRLDEGIAQDSEIISFSYC